MSEDVNTSLSQWQATFLSIMERCIPKIVLRSRKNLPWLTKQLIQAARKKRRLFQQSKKTGKVADYDKYRRFHNRFTNMLKQSKQRYLRGLRFLNKKHFWKAIKSLNQHKTSIPTLVEDNKFASSNSEKAEILNNFFSHSFNFTVPPLSFADCDDLGTVDPSVIDDILCTVEYVEHQLLGLDISKANGPDGISARMLKGSAKSIAPSVTNLFNLSLKSGLFPILWKTSHVVPIPKAKEYTSPSNYRPISLLSILSKILERHVHSLITEHISVTHPLADNQWGFRARRGTTLALLTATNDAKFGLWN